MVGAVLQLEPGDVPVGRAARVLGAEVDMGDVGRVDAHLPGEALDHARAFAVTAEEGQSEGDAFAKRLIGSAQELDRLDEAGDADHRVSAGHGPDRADHLRNLDRMVA